MNHSKSLWGGHCYSERMQTFYWLCAIFGGVFVLLSAIGGTDGIDFDPNGGLDAEFMDPGEAQSVWNRRPLWMGYLKSLKFWTFGVGFFGLAGVLFSATQPSLAGVWVFVLALLMGLTMGFAAAAILQALRRQRVNSLIQAQDWVGAKGTVELPFDAKSRGKVRLQLKGSLVGAIAFTNDPKPLNIGDVIVVIGSENNRVWVVSDETLHHIQEESAPS
jgi:hypothetical protein